MALLPALVVLPPPWLLVAVEVPVITDDAPPLEPPATDDAPVLEDATTMDVAVPLVPPALLAPPLPPAEDEATPDDDDTTTTPLEEPPEDELDPTGGGTTHAATHSRPLTVQSSVPCTSGTPRSQDPPRPITSSTRPLQSSSPPPQVSAVGRMPGTHSRPPAPHANRPLVQLPTPQRPLAGQHAVFTPGTSSTVPLQSVSRPSHSSGDGPWKPTHVIMPPAHRVIPCTQVVDGP